MEPEPIAERYDVVVIGGAFSGAATALLLRRELPALSVLVVEKSRVFDSKVGEATTEMAGMFITRRLALWSHLEAEHLPKEGLRYWAADDHVQHHHEASEAGGFHRSTVPSFQLRRDVLDQHLLDLAAGAGAEVVRPGRVREVESAAFAQRVEIETESGRRTVSCRWLIDASGRATFLGKRLGLVERLADHPVSAMWCRWRGVAHLDDVAALGPPDFAARNISSRRLATNHYSGRGYWVWVIPLGNGETSIGVVWDRRLLELARNGDRSGEYERFVRQVRPLAELLEGAEMRPRDFRYYSDLPYLCRQYAGEGWALVGDAGAFLDPYYSPGLDHACFTIEGTLELIRRDTAGEPFAERLAEHNAAFQRSYRRFFEAIYRDKYRYLGEHDLVAAAMLLDTAQYYLFIVIPAYRIHRRFHWLPVLGDPRAFFNYHLMRLYNRRFAAIADTRLERGAAGRRNHGRRVVAYFALDSAPLRMSLRAARLWAAAELDALWLRLTRRRVESEQAQPSHASATALELDTPRGGKAAAQRPADQGEDELQPETSPPSKPSIRRAARSRR